MILEKVDENLDRQRNKPFNTPQGSLRVFDLVKPNADKYRNALYFAFRDNLVCENIDTAHRISQDVRREQRKIKVVTKEGAVFDFTGIATGGGKPQKGGMSSKMVEEITEERIQQAAEMAREAERKLSTQRDNLQVAENRLHQLKTDMLSE